MPISLIGLLNTMGEWRTAANEMISRFNILGTSDDITITGGDIDGTNIGITTPAPAKFTTINLPYNGFVVSDLDNSHTTTFLLSSNLSANRTFTINLNNANRVLDLQADLTVTANSILSGSNTGDQTITLTGDISGSGTGSFITAITNNAVTLAKIQQIATGNLLGRSTAGTGNVELIPTTTTGFSLLNSASVAAARTFLDVQQLNARLTDIATNLTATTGSIEKTGVNTFGTYPVSAFAKTLLDDADAATARTTLGISSIAAEVRDQLFVATTDFTQGVTTTLTITNAPIASSSTALSVYFNGIRQHNAVTEYTYNTGTGEILFTNPIPIGVNEVYVSWVSSSLPVGVPSTGSIGYTQLSSGIIATLAEVIANTANKLVSVNSFRDFLNTNTVTQTFNAGTHFTAGTTTVITITNTPIAPTSNVVDVYFDGVYQHHSEYTYNPANGQITFASAIPLAVSAIFVKWYGAYGQANVPSDGSMTFIKFASGAIATAAEMLAGTASKILSAIEFKTYMDANVYPRTIKGWINFNGIGTPAINGSYNIAGSVVDNGVGDYTINLTTPVSTTGVIFTSTANGTVGTIENSEAQCWFVSSTQIRVRVRNTATGAALDTTNIHIGIFG